MPAAIAAAVAYISTAIETVGLAVGISGPLFTDIAFDAAYAIVATGASMLISGVTSLISGAVSSATRTQGLVVSATSPNAPWRVVYGFARLGGVITFMTSSGSNNEYIHLVLTICQGKIQSIDTLYFDDVAIPLDSNGNGQGEWAGYVHAEFDVGDPANTSQPFPGLASAVPGYWNDTCLQRGHAKAYVQLKWSNNLFSTGAPNITFDVKGRQVYDPRTSTTAWSTNPALCIRDYLTDQTIGLMADPATEINDTSVIAAANICDETIALAGTVTSAVIGSNNGDGGSGYVTGDLVRVAGGNGDCALWVAETTAGGKVQRLNVSDPGSGYATATSVATTGGSGTGLIVNITSAGASEPQYTCNGVFQVSSTPGQILNDMSLSMSGYVTYVQGQFHTIAGAWATPTVTLTDDDLRDTLQVQTRYSRRDIFNSVRGTYLSEANNWQPSDYPAVIDGVWVNEDGLQLWNQIDLPFTTSASMAQRIAKIQLERSRRQITVTAKCKLTAGMIQPGDVIQFTHARFNWTAKTFFVTDVNFVSDDSNGAPVLGVDLLLQETDSNIYSWTAGDEIAVLPPSLAPTPDNSIVAPPTAVTATSGEAEAAIGADGIITNRILVQWTAPADYFVQSGGKIIIQHRLSTGPGPWLPAIIADGAATQAYIAPVSGNTNYDIAIWAENASGATSPIVEVLSVNTSTLVSTFTGEAGTVSTLSNFTQDNLKSGTNYQQTPNYQSNENMIQNPTFLAGMAGWAGGSLVSDTLPNGQTGNVYQVTSQNYSGAVQSNISTLIPGDTYLFSGWMKTGGAGSWAMYRGNYPDASFFGNGSPTVWTSFSTQYTVPSNSNELAGQMLWLNAGATLDWIRVWGCSITLVRNLDTQVTDGSTYARPLSVRIADGKPWVDLSETINQGRTTINISESSGLYYAAEHGADITGNHTSANSNQLGGVAAGSITPIVGLMPAEAASDKTILHAVPGEATGLSDVTLTGGDTISTTGVYIDFTINAAGGNLLAWFEAPFKDAVDVERLILHFYLDGVDQGNYAAIFQSPWGATYFQTLMCQCPLVGLSAGSHTLEVYYQYGGSTGNCTMGTPQALTLMATS